MQQPLLIYIEWGEVEDKTTAEEGALSDRFYLLFVNKDAINTIGTPVLLIMVKLYLMNTEKLHYLKQNNSYKLI